MRRDGKAEIRDRRRKLTPVCCTIGRMKNTIVMLHPQRVGIGGATRHAMWILNGRVVALLRRHVRCEHTLSPRPPALSAIRRLPHAAARNADGHVIGILGMDEYRMYARIVIAAAEPARALGYVPQGINEPPSRAAILRHEQSSRNATCPQHAGLVARFERPDLLQRRRAGRIL